jgi:hypothetical protein
MGEVVSLDAYRRAREVRLAGVSTVGGDDGAVERLEHAIRRLEAALQVVIGTGSLDEPEFRREILAVSGAVAAGRYARAAERTERLTGRLRMGRG